MGNLRDGKVFVEILKHFLQREGLINGFIKEINSAEKMSPIRRFLFVIESMSKVDDNKMIKRKFEKFYNNYQRLFKDEDFLLDFVALLRIIFEKEIENDIEEDHPKALIQRNNNDFIVQSGTFANDDVNVNEEYNYYQHRITGKAKAKVKGKIDQYPLNEDIGNDDKDYNNDNGYSNQINNNQGNTYKAYNDEKSDFQEDYDGSDNDKGINKDNENNMLEGNSPDDNNEEDNDSNYYNQKQINHNYLIKDNSLGANGNQDIAKPKANTINQSAYSHTKYKKQIQMKEMQNTSSYYSNDDNNYNLRNENNYHTTEDNNKYRNNYSNNHNYVLSTQNQMNTHFNTAFTPQATQPRMEIDKNDHFGIHPLQIKTEKKSIKSKPAILNQQQRSMTPIKHQIHSPLYNHNSNLNDFDLSMISKKYSQAGAASSDNSFYTQIDPSKLYTKRKKAEINMSRGMQYQNKLYKIEHKNIKIPYLKVVLPTQPITIVSYNEIIKYQVVSNSNSSVNVCSKNTYKTNSRRIQGLDCKENYIPKPKHQPQPQPAQIPQAILAPSKSNRDRKPDINSISNISITPINQHESSLRQNLNAFNNNCKQMDIQRNDGISLSTKNKIYSWLIDAGILKDKSINLSDLPNICINGVLLCDLINRCEGRNESIHGIIRKTTTKSQIQVNVNKVLVHLRSIEKFSSRHLWSHNEIVQGHSQTIWELLEDLYSFYSIKTKFVSRSKSKHKMQQNQQTQQATPDHSILVQDPLINQNLSEVTPFENNHHPTPLNNNNNMHRMQLQLPYQNISIDNQFRTNIEPVKPKKDFPRIQSNNQLRKPSKNVSMTRCNTNNNMSVLNSNNKQSSNVSVIQKHNQSFQSHIPTSSNISGFLLFEKSTVKRLKQNIDQISAINTTHS